VAEIVNLRTARKRQARAQAEAKAAENRAIHGRTKHEKQASHAHEAREGRRLDGAKRERD